MGEAYTETAPEDEGPSPRGLVETLAQLDGMHGCEGVCHVLLMRFLVRAALSSVEVVRVTDEKQDFHTARVSGQHSEVERLSKLMAQVSQEWQQVMTAL